MKAGGGILELERFKKGKGRCLKEKSEIGKFQPKIYVENLTNKAAILYDNK